jgi:hypothetical protein
VNGNERRRKLEIAAIILGLAILFSSLHTGNKLTDAVSQAQQDRDRAYASIESKLNQVQEACRGR